MIPRRPLIRRARGGLVFGCLGIVLAAAGAVRAESVEDLEVTVGRGFFEAPFDVEIATETQGAVIRYTLDGSAPSESHGLIYESPIIVNTTTVLRAAAFKDGLDPTRVETQTYVFLDDVLQQTGEGFPEDWGSYGTFDTEPGNHPPGPHAADYAMDPEVVNDPLYAPTIRNDLRAIPTLALAMDVDDWFSDEVRATDGKGVVTESRGIYPIGKGFERAVSAEFILPDGSSAFQINCSVEIQGATSTDRWKTAKLSMRLKFKAPFGPSELDYPLFGDDATDNVNTVILDSTNQQAWTHPVTAQQQRAQYVRDQFVGDIQNAMGGIAPHGRHAHVYINGLYWGVYWLHEFVEEAFAVAYRGGKREDYDVLRHRADNVVAGSALDYALMLAVVSQDQSVPANYAAMDEFLDIPGFVDYMLANFYAGNADWAFQNWNATGKRTAASKRWHFHNWDGEKTFQDVTDDSTDKNDPGAPTFIHQQLRANPEYRLLFADRVRKHFFNGGVMSPATATQMYLARLNTIDRAIVGESARWGDNRNPDNPPYTRADWIAERDRLVNTFFPARTGIVLGQLRDDGLYPQTEAPEFSMHGGEVTAGETINMAHPNAGGGTIFYTMDGSDPRDPGAQTYAGPVPINASLVMKARVRNAADTEWSALTEAVFLVTSTVQDLRVTELMYHPGRVSGAEEAAGFSDEDEFEFLEVKNTGPSMVPLEGVRFSEGVRFVFPSLTLQSGESVVVANDLAAFEERYGPGAATVAGEFDGSLSNSGESLALRGAFGELIQSFAYDDEWYPATDGDGFSLVVADDSAPVGDWNLQSGWRRSAFGGGSPGSDDIEPASLRITEIQFHPEGPDDVELQAGFMDADAFEFVEIANVGAESVNMNGVRLREGVDFVFGNVTLGGGARLVVVRDQAAFLQRYGAGAATIAGEFQNDTELGNGGERIALLGPAGETIHDFEYDDDWDEATDGVGASLVVRDESQGLEFWNDAGGWRASAFNHGSPGDSDPVGISQLRVTEVMFAPPPPTPEEQIAGFDNAGDFDYLELQNVGDTELDLQGYTIEVGVSFTFGAEMLQPGERILVVEDEEAFVARYGNGPLVAGTYSQGLGGDDVIVLKDSLGNVLLDFEYKNGWYAATNGNGSSLEIVDATRHPSTWDEKSSWRPSASFGSPGGDATPYYAWQWERFGESGLASGPDDDPDADWIPNLLEYLLALDPREADPPPVRGVVIEEGGVHHAGITFVRDLDATDATIRVQVSADLENWADAGAVTESYVVTPLEGNRERVTVRLLADLSAMPSLYLRVSGSL